MKKTALWLGIGFLCGLARADEGARLFTAKCQTCHAKDGHGNPALKKVYGAGIDLLDAESQNKEEAVWLVNIREGAVKGKMPAFKKKLTEDQMKAIIAYVRGMAAAGETK